MTGIILASGSPRRKALLTQAGFALQCLPPDCDETWHPGESAPAYAARIALKKATQVAQSSKLAPAIQSLRAALAGATKAQDPSQPLLILAADTTVWIPGQDAPMGKPQNRDAARQGLTALFDAGEHRVSTAFCLLDALTQRCLTQACISTLVGMRTPSLAELERYLDTQEWSDKAGGYGIQGAAAGFVTRLEGSYTNVVGLPLAELLQAIAQIEAGRKARDA